MLARKYVSGTAHISSQLVDILNPVHSGARHILITQVADYKFVCLAFAVLVLFQIDAPNPESLCFQTLDQMSADETAGSSHQYSFFRHAYF
jgi:hypothetical protein